VLRKIPPNLFYGVRTRKTLSDPRIWYEANYQGGIALIVASLFGLICWAVIFSLWGRDVAGSFGIFPLIAAIILATGVCLIRIRNL
jgi:hypothetical protein